MNMLVQAAVFFGAAVIVVPIFRKLGLGAVLGYLAAGALIGPFGLKMINDVEAIMHFAEFGVVLLLFIIGLELQPARLWTFRNWVFGFGGAQVVVTGLALGGGAVALGIGVAPASTPPPSAMSWAATLWPSTAASLKLWQTRRTSS